MLKAQPAGLYPFRQASLHIWAKALTGLCSLPSSCCHWSYSSFGTMTVNIKEVINSIQDGVVLTQSLLKELRHLGSASGPSGRVTRVLGQKLTSLGFLHQPGECGIESTIKKPILVCSTFYVRSQPSLVCFWIMLTSECPSLPMLKLDDLESSKDQASGPGSAFGLFPCIYSGTSSLVGRKGASSARQFSILPQIGSSNFSCFCQCVCMCVCKYRYWCLCTYKFTFFLSDRGIHTRTQVCIQQVYIPTYIYIYIFQ